jgi:hypothetical protein
VIDSSHDSTTPCAGDTPRRDAVRMMGAAGVALLGVVGLRDGAQGKKRKQGRHKGGKRDKIGLTSALSDPFSLPANVGLTQRAFCPAGFVAINGGLQGVSDVTVPCMIRESRPTPDGTQCLEGTGGRCCGAGSKCAASIAPPARPGARGTPAIGVHA